MDLGTPSGLEVLGDPKDFYDNLYNLKMALNQPILNGGQMKVHLGNGWIFDGENLYDGEANFEFKTAQLTINTDNFDLHDEVFKFLDERVALYEVIFERMIYSLNVAGYGLTHDVVPKESYPSFVYPDSDLVLMTRQTTDPIKYIEIFDRDGDFVLAREFTVTKRGKVKDKLGKVLKSGYHIGSFIGDTVELVRTSFDPSELGDYFKTVHISELDEIFNQD